LRTIVVEGAPLAAAHADEIAEELRVKEVEFGHVDAELRVKPHLPVLGPKLGKELGAVRAALQAGDFEELGGGRFRAAGHELGPEEVLVERAGKEGWAVAGEDGVTVALDTAVDESLEREGRVYELIHRVNSMRKDAGLELTDRITLTLPAADGDLVEHSDWIAYETLAVAIDVGDSDAPTILVA
jgi:isoleucyl-tRNA synthetase